MDEQNTLRRCVRCVMPDTRPRSVFDAEGVCLACRNYEKNILVDWDERYRRLEGLCDRHRRDDGYYDCIIPVSGGKDSYLQTYIIKEKLGMNPLLICVADPFTPTEVGKHNLKNLSETFNCDLVVFNLSVDMFRRVTKIGFEELGEPLRFLETAIYTVPFKYAVALNIPLVVFGENAAYMYGATSEDNYSAYKYIEAGHSASGDKLSHKITGFWEERGISLSEMNAIIPPSPEQIEMVMPEAIFMSYFIHWDDEYNADIARRCGFKDLYHEWDREGCVEDYSQIDSLAYLVHLWMKWPKFGFQRVSDIVSRWVRKGAITRDEAMELVVEYDHKLDQMAMDDFNSFMGYKTREFWDIMERFWNGDIFEKKDGLWRIRK